MLSWLRETLDEANLIFDKFDIQNEFILINHDLLLGKLKFTVYSWKCQNDRSSVQGFIARAKCAYNVQFYFTRKRDKLTHHFKNGGS